MRTIKELKKDLGVEEIPKRGPAPRRDPDAHLGAVESSGKGEQRGSLHPTQAPPVVDDSSLILPAGVFNREVIDEWLRRSDCHLDLRRH